MGKIYQQINLLIITAARLTESCVNCKCVLLLLHHFVKLSGINLLYIMQCVLVPGNNQSSYRLCGNSYGSDNEILELSCYGYRFQFLLRLYG